ncbi:glycosyltransferase family 2 protein [Agromyces sp. SYSU K20354]|uniref:glycosyltransferase family 2 protein n=1 Tax=Agromyces cavernae TaxID=2898659 RepID=UPI001E359618|nr:glycosyltransferase family 2 protein [Agromyces cavernae]MCD2444219.1 glycosyltransferase family 2 protein [Agromyces cavernae]
MRLNHLAVVMPAYNEAVGIPGFVRELHANLAPLAERLDIVVVDDRSTDATAGVLTDLAAELPGLHVITAEQNRGHGPTALSAYHAGLELEPDLIVHVDGDGQFHGADLARLVTASVDTGADVVHGVRTGRTDPWFRRVLTASVGVLVTVAAGRRIPDVNTPLRAYRPTTLRTLVAAVPEGAHVPHVHFSIAEARGGASVRYLRVASLPRRGGDAQGTMWSEGDAVVQPQPMLPPKRLREFVRAAAVELWHVSLKPGKRS